jgi:hypothetical protein
MPLGIKKGANQTDINQINRMYADGKMPTQISKELGIDLACIESYQPSLTKKPKSTQRNKKNSTPASFEEAINEG